MTTRIEDNELNEELHELYLKNKQWLSQLEFLESELEFLKKLYGRTFTSLIKNDDLEKISEILLKVAAIQNTQAELKNAIIAYLRVLEPLIVKPSQSFDISIVLTHTAIETKLNEVLNSFQLVKDVVFNLTKNGLKEDAPLVLN